MSFHRVRVRLESVRMAGKARVALQYCGGCDATYDRVRYWREIRDAGAGRIEWVTLVDVPFQAVLLVNGCERACRERDPGAERRRGVRIVSVRDNAFDPREIVERLLR